MPLKYNPPSNYVKSQPALIFDAFAANITHLQITSNHNMRVLNQVAFLNITHLQITSNHNLEAQS